MKVKQELFPILEDLAYSGNAATSNVEVENFVEQLKKLEAGSKIQSVLIPTSFCPTRRGAANFFNKVKRHIDTNKIFEDSYFASKGIKTENGIYLGTRVWRLK